MEAIDPNVKYQEPWDAKIPDIVIIAALVASYLLLPPKYKWYPTIAYGVYKAFTFKLSL